MMKYQLYNNQFLRLLAHSPDAAITNDFTSHSETISASNTKQDRLPFKTGLSDEDLQLAKTRYQAAE